LQINASGELIDAATSPYILLGWNLSNVLSIDIYPQITHRYHYLGVLHLCGDYCLPYR